MWLNKNHLVIQERLKRKQLNIVVTGGSKGLGRSLAKEFTLFGDNVTILSRSNGYNISDKVQLRETIDKIAPIDIWINNAAVSGGYNTLQDTSIDKIEEIILTNFLGTCLATKIIYDIMKKQISGGSIYNIAGAGSNGFPTPKFAVYGATKAGISQFTRSIQIEACDKVKLSMVSPGMMMTDLLTENLDPVILNKIKPFISDPEDVGKHLAGKIRESYYLMNTTKIEYFKFNFRKIFEKLI